MRRSLPLIVCAASLLVSLPALAAKTRAHAPAKSAAAHGRATKTASSHAAATLHRTNLKKGSHVAAASIKNPHGHLAQVSMDSERATQIQTALIKKGYLSGEPTGKWDAASIAAMQKLQSDNGWQTKIMPDSRAIIKLGLGPGADASMAAATTAGAPAQ